MNSPRARSLDPHRRLAPRRLPDLRAAAQGRQRRRRRRMIQRSRATQPMTASTPLTIATISQPVSPISSSICRVEGYRVESTVPRDQSRIKWQENPALAPDIWWARALPSQHDPGRCRERMMWRAFPLLVLPPVKSRKAYGTALLAVGLAFACTYLAVPLAERAQLFLLLAAVVVSAWYGGLGPGLLATAVARGGQAACIEAPDRDELVRILLFVLGGGAISALAAGRR